MRYLFFILLLANGLFWLWQTYVFAPPPQLNGALPRGAEPLVLLAEQIARGSQSSAEPVLVAATKPPLPSTPAVIEPPSPPVEAAVAVVEPEPASTDNAPAEITPSDAPLSEPVVVALDPDPAPLTDAAPQTLALVSERRPAALAPPVQRCYTIGPFRDPVQAGDVQRRLFELSITSGQRILSEREFFGYSVYLPPRASRNDARALTRQLRAQGITDYYIMTDAQLRNAVSLGLFRERSHAERLRDRVQSLGFSPRLEARYRERELRWLDYRDDQEMVGVELLREWSPEGGVQRLDRDC